MAKRLLVAGGTTRGEVIIDFWLLCVCWNDGGGLVAGCGKIILDKIGSISG
jgi:hypothetical protein